MPSLRVKRAKKADHIPIHSMFAAHSRPRETASDADVARIMHDENNRQLDEIGRRADAELDAELDASSVQSSTLPPAKRRKPHEPPSAPADLYSAECTPLLVVFPYADVLANLLKKLGSTGDNVTLDFDKDTGLRVRQMSQSQQCVVDVLMSRDQFLVWRMPVSNHACTLFYEQLVSFAKSVKNTQTLSLFTAPSQHPDRLCARVHNARTDRTFMFNTLDSSNEPDWLDLDPRAWKYPLCVRMTPIELAEEVRAADSAKASAVEWSVNDQGRFCWHTFADSTGNNDQKTRSFVSYDGLERCADVPAVRQQFSVRLLKLLCVAGLAAHSVSLHFGLRDHPLWLEFRVTRPGANDDAPDTVAVDNVLVRIDSLLMPRYIDYGGEDMAAAI